MTFWKIFINSLQIPRKIAVFNLNRIRMDYTVVYMFILIAIVSFPPLIEQIRENSTSTFYVHTFFLLIFFFMFYYLIIVIGIFILISVYAYLGTIIAKITNRRLHFSIIWKIIAFSLTLPFIILTIISIFIPLSNYLFWLFVIYTFIILIKVVTIYPVVKK